MDEDENLTPNNRNDANNLQGIGKVTALFLAGRGARVIMACRNMAKSQPIADDIIATTGNPAVVVRLLDVSDLTSVRKFVEQIIEEEEYVHILINNAGIYPRGLKRISAQDFELTMATNHYGPFLLTNLLLDKLKASAPSRVVTVSSELHRYNTIVLDDLNYEHRAFSNFKAYCQSKLCNVLFTRELARRLKGSGVTANCLCPGFTATDIFNKDANLFGKIHELSARILGRTSFLGAQTIIYLALSEKVEGKSGGYYDNSRKAGFYFKANDMDLASKLWERSCQAVGLAD